MIELHTYMLAVGIGNLSFALLMAAYMGSTTPTPGLRTWMWARLAFGATQLLAYARPDTGMTVLAVIESAGWTAGLTLEVAAYASFFGYPQLRRHLLPVSSLALLLACAAPTAGFGQPQLMAVVSTVMGVGSLLVGAVLLHPRLPEATSLQRLIGANDAVFGGALALWGVIAMLDAAPAPWLQVLAYVAGYMLLIVNGFGFLLMSKERDDARMERLATTDDLTGLLNRRAFFARADAARMLAQRQGQPIALLMLDIDHFKQINDRFGHATGDEALLKFSTACCATLREYDILGRLGGEEFALVLPDTGLAGAHGAAERLRQEVMKTCVLTCGNHYTMTVSIGLVVIDPEEDLPSALARADHALYQAKHAGRNRVEADIGLRRHA
ncbi:GGDEF domain-containing protein [Massilia niabensis]|uniref:diguanylate cyclase n=1 Tax=Massilia niabensis TaxID=544910 RepID=A0ABW0L227_9BURK